MRQRGLFGAAVTVVACAVGCGSSASWSAGEYRYSYYSSDEDPWSRRAFEEPSDAPPSLALADDEIEAALAPRLQVVVAPPRAVDRLPVELAAREVELAYLDGDRARARALIAAHPGLVDWSEPEVVVSCRFVSGYGAGIEPTAIRNDTSLGAPREPLAVCFEPGTFGVAVDSSAGSGPLADLDGGGRPRWTQPDSERRYGHWPEAQDLALLRAPTLVIPRGEVIATVRVPVACASFHRGAPEGGQPYALARFPEGSQIDRLMVVLCAGDDVPGDAEAQLAVWMARDDVSWTEFAAEGGDRGRLVTFGANAPVRAAHAQGAASLLLRAGVDPRALRLFDEEAGSRPRQGEDAPAEVAPAPEPTPPEPTLDLS